ncbi:MAG: hypothetical protein ACERKZ_05850 [Lachnotalea sp.]
MTEFELNLLKNAYNNLLNSGDATSTFIALDNDLLISALNSFESLQQSNYIELSSDNLDKGVLTIVKKDGTISEDIKFIYTLTSSGIEFCRNNFDI